MEPVIPPAQVNHTETLRQVNQSFEQLAKLRGYKVYYDSSEDRFLGLGGSVATVAGVFGTYARSVVGDLSQIRTSDR